MRIIVIVFVMLAFSAIGGVFSGNCLAQTASVSSAVAPSGEDFAAVQEFLLTSAAADFYENQPPLPYKFRKVRIGRVGKDVKDAQYMLCGEFLALAESGRSKWTKFITIKTAGYEQYIGSSTSYCSDRRMIWHKTGDLSQKLQARLDDLKKNTGRVHLPVLVSDDRAVGQHGR